MGDVLTQLAVSLGLTVLFELLFARVCGVRGGRALCTVALVNCLTNPPVVLLSILAEGRGVPPLAARLLLEAAAVLAEGAIYRGARLTGRPYVFSLGANAFSYCMGALASYTVLLCSR